jgi:hypothetical protein
MPTFLQAVLLPEWCFLYEALYWVAFQRLPIASYTVDAEEYRLSEEVENYEAEITDSPHLISEDEAKFAGIPPDPQWVAWTEDRSLLPAREYEGVLTKEVLKGDEDFKNSMIEARDAARRLEEECRAWEAHFRRAIEYPISRIFVALRGGQLKAKGKLLFNVHKNTVRAWFKQGLVTIDGHRPTVIRGDEIRRFLIERRARAKQVCGPGRIYCLPCRAPKVPAGKMAECVASADTSGTLLGICPDCGRMIYRRVNPTKLDAVPRLLEQLDRQVVTVGPRTSIRNDQGLVDKRVDEQPAPAGQLVPRRHRNNRRLIKQHQHFDPLVDVLRRPNERQVQSSGEQPRQKPNGLVLDKLHSHIGTVLTEVVKKFGHQSCRRRIDRTDSQYLGPPAPAFAKPQAEPVSLREERPCLADQREAIVGEGDVSSRSEQQLRSKRLLQQPDMAAQRRRQHVEPAGGLAEVQFLCDRDETTKLVQLHTPLVRSLFFSSRIIVSKICIIHWLL